MLKINGNYNKHMQYSNTPKYIVLLTNTAQTKILIGMDVFDVLTPSKVNIS